MPHCAEKIKKAVKENSFSPPIRIAIHSGAFTQKKTNAEKV